MPIARVNTWSPDGTTWVTNPGTSQRHAPGISFDGTFMYVSRFIGTGANPEDVAVGTYGQWRTKKFTVLGAEVSDTTVNIVEADPPNFPAAATRTVARKCREDASVWYQSWFDGGSTLGGIFYRDFGNTVSDFRIDTTDVGWQAFNEVLNPFTRMWHSSGQYAYYMLGTDVVGPNAGECKIRRMFGPVWDDLNDPVYYITGFGSGGQFAIFPSTTGHIYVANHSIGLWRFDEDLNLVHSWVGAGGFSNFTQRLQCFFCGNYVMSYIDLGDGQPRLAATPMDDATLPETWVPVATIDYASNLTPASEIVGIWTMEDGRGFVQDGVISCCIAGPRRVVFTSL